MSYNCKDCGAYEGIEMGMCKNCTPKSVIAIDEELKTIHLGLKAILMQELNSLYESHPKVIELIKERELIINSARYRLGGKYE